MNGMQNRKVHNMEKPFPGCLGRMVNLFDLSPGVSGNRLLTDKPHGDGSSLSRSQSDVSTMLTPRFGDHIQEKLIVSELSRTSYNKVNGTPMKMLIAQELSKEGEAKCNSPNIVAKLMGLDHLPHQQSDPATIRSHSKGYSRRSLSHSSIPSGCWQQEDGFVDKGIQSEYMEESERRDIHEIWLKSQKANNFRDKSPQKRHSDNINEKKMALVHQKFMEAKRLATDEKLRQSKEFQEALEVLSSNKDLFLKFLQEPNSLFSQHLYGVQSVPPPPPETNRITVLRPSKMADEETLAGSGNKNDKQIKKPAQASQVTAWEKSNKGYPSSFANQNTEEHPSQPTRIVVLKPTLGKSSDIKAMISPLSMPSRILRGKDSLEEPGDEARESREVAKEITQHMRDNLMGYRRDETLLSVFSNGYVGDESSFNKSEDEYAGGNLTDSEVTSPTSRHSWDYLNRFGSPYSPSSFSRTSCSPESSVCREAKKRLSERWAMMASSGGPQEQRHVRRGSSTLGEMLALSDSKKLVKSEDDSDSREQKPGGSTSIVSSNINKEDCDDSSINLLRTKSLPVSSTMYAARLNVEASDSEVGKSHAPEELTRAKSTKSSLRGKVSKLFFSRSKRLNIERSSASLCINESQSSTIEAAGSLVHPHGANASPSNNDCGLEECLSPGSCIIGHPDLIGTIPKQTVVSQEGVVSVVKPAMSGNINENLKQPSPISVLEPPFQEDDSTTTVSSSCSKPDQQGMCGSIASIQSNLIDKSPLIGSIARTLSWDDSCTETATPHPLDCHSATTGAIGEEQEQEWLASVRTVLSAAGLDGGEVQWDSLLTKWYSPESPLDPSLRDKYTNSTEEPLHEGKRRQRRSSRKLVFDCVNEALAETTLGNSVAGRECWSRGLLGEHVWGRMKEWMYREDGCDSSDGEEDMVVDRAVRREMMGRGWNEKMREEGDNVGKEIQGKLLQELVEEVVVDFTFTTAFPFSSSSQFIL